MQKVIMLFYIENYIFAIFQIFIPKRHSLELDALAVNIQIFCDPILFYFRMFQARIHILI